MTFRKDRVLTALLAADGSDLTLLSVPAVCVPDGVSCNDVAMFRANDGLTSVAVIGRDGPFATRASHDDLTGLPNRSVFFAEIAAVCGRSREGDDAIVAVLYIDVDGFKQINDTRGLNAGDTAVVAAAKLLALVTRDGDLVARLGGDELSVLLELTSRDPRGLDDDHAAWAAALGERYRIALGGGSIALIASVGVAICRPGLVDAATLLREADMAMYAAKGAGGWQHPDRGLLARRPSCPMRSVSDYSPTLTRGS